VATGTCDKEKEHELVLSESSTPPREMVWKVWTDQSCGTGWVSTDSRTQFARGRYGPGGAIRIHMRGPGWARVYPRRAFIWKVVEPSGMSHHAALGADGTPCCGADPP